MKFMDGTLWVFLLLIVCAATKDIPQLNIEKNCGKDDICVPDLQLYAKFNLEQYSIGIDDRLQLYVKVRNHGEDAFESKFHLTTPPDVNYVNIDRSKLDFSVTCAARTMPFDQESSAKNHLECSIGNPLPANKTVEFKIVLKPSHVISSSTGGFIFNMIVNSTNVEKNDTLFNNLFEIHLPVSVLVSLTIRGISVPETIVYNKSEKLPESVSSESVGPEITHIYEVTNEGPSSVGQIEVYFLWPTYTMSGRSLLYPIEEPEVSGNAVCEKMEEVNPLKMQEIRKRRRTQNITSQDLTHPVLFHTMKENKLRPASENSLENEARRDKRALNSEFEKELSCGPTLGPKIRCTSFDKGDPLSTRWRMGRETYNDVCGPTLCTKIRCTISNLKKRESVTISMRSRMWRKTYNDFGLIKVDKMLIASKCVTRITALPYGVDPSNLPYEVHEASTQVFLLHPDIAVASNVYPSWSTSILLICCGLVLLALLALLL